MIVSAATKEGVVLLGEAAQEYVRYCYFKTIFDPITVFLVFAGFGWLVWRLVKRYGDFS